MRLDGAPAMVSLPGAARSPADLVTEVVEMATATRRMLAAAGIALQTRDPDQVRAVAATSGRIGLAHATLERDVVDLMVGGPPDADDMRRLMALITTGTLLERMAVVGVALARLALEPDAAAAPPALPRGLVVMTTRICHLLDEAVQPWRGSTRDICSAPVHLARELEEAHAALFGELVATARAGLALAPVLWVDRAIGLLHEAGQLAVDIAETARLAPRPTTLPSCAPAGRR